MVLGTGRAMQGRRGGACTTGLGTGPDAEHDRRGVWDMCKPNPKPETMTIGLAQEVPIRAGATGAAGWDRYKRAGQLAGSQRELNLSPGILRQLSQPMPSPSALCACLDEGFHHGLAAPLAEVSVQCCHDFVNAFWYI